MKKHILLFATLLMTPWSMFNIQCSTTWAQSYVVSSLATPGAATFKADEIKDGVITLPFTMTMKKITVDTNQAVSVKSGAMWLRASFMDGVLSLMPTLNNTGEPRTTTLTITSKDFRPLIITVKQEAPLSFAVISDTHVGNTCGAGYKVKIPQALQTLTSKGALDALVVVGDLTDGGTTKQYEEFVGFFGDEENIVNPVDNFLFMMGNHDNFDGNGKKNYTSGLQAFNEGNDYPLHQYKLIKGYPFITISTLGKANNDLSNDDNGTNSYPSDTVEELERMLAKATEDAPGKPIFIFTHVPPRWTCYSAWAEYENGEAWCMKVLNKTLNKYPQAVVFAGHSHYPLGDPRSIHQGANPNSSRNNYYTAINTASTTYSEIHPKAVEAGIHPEGYTDVTEGMILVEKTNGDIEIRRYDTYRDIEIDPENRWVLKAPFDGSQFQYADIRDKDDNPNGVSLRDGLPAPKFDEEASLEVVPSEDDVKVTFPQATDNECVFRYNIRVLKDNMIVKSAFEFSQFYLTTDMPQELSYTVSGLKPNTEYKLEVIAYDSWDNQSEALSTTFTTLNDDRPVPEAVGCWTFDDGDNLLAGSGKATLTGAVIKSGNLNTSADLASIGITPVDGPQDGNGAISIPVGSGLKMANNLTKQSLSSYTLMFDICSKELSGYTALYQNDLTNKKDGSFFIHNSGLGINSNGLGYNGTLTSGKWHRVVFVVKNNLPTIYLDGLQIGQAASANATNWQMGTGALFFLDDNGEEHNITASEIRFWDEPLNSKQVIKLGTATGEAIPEPNPIPEAIGIWTFDLKDNPMAGSGIATLQPANHSTDSSSPYVTVKDNIADAGITTIAGPSERNGALKIPVGSSLKLTSNIGVESMNTYSILWDVKADDYSNYIPLLQNDLSNTKDGSLFINQNMVGLNAGNMKYHGNLINGQWYRILFVVDNNYATVYVNGEKVGFSTSAVPKHWQLPTGALFFADNDGEEKTIETGEIRFWDKALTAEQAKQLDCVE